MSPYDLSRPLAWVGEDKADRLLISDVTRYGLHRTVVARKGEVMDIEAWQQAVGAEARGNPVECFLVDIGEYVFFVDDMEGETDVRKVLLFVFVLAACSPAPGYSTPVPPTVDPFVAVAAAQNTAEAAQEQADMYAGQLTATAQAPIMAITSTAAAWQMEQQYAQATQVSQMATETAAWTATAMSWTPTPNATATLAAVNVMATQQFTANDIEQDNLAVKRDQMVNPIRAGALWVGLIVFGLFAGLFAISWSRRFAVVPVPTDARGQPQPMFDVVEGVAFDTDRMVNGAMAMRRKDVIKLLPQITAERQDAVVQRDQLIDLRSRSGAMKRLVDTQINPLPQEERPGQSDELFPLPTWAMAGAWNRNKDDIPCGTSSNGLELWDTRIHPHLAIFGMTRSGKSRRALRPLVTFMLASNQRVVLIGKEIDFLPFIGHPNAVFLPIYDTTERTESEKYARALAACVEEKNRRIRQMAQSGVSLWQDERTFIVLDELGNAILEMASDLADLTMKRARSMVNEGGKAGMSLVFSAQRPKGFIDLTTQCGRAVFSVTTDQERKYALGMNGADRLPEIPTGYYYKKFRSLQLIGAFEPTDDDIRSYLNSRPAQRLNKADWIDGQIETSAEPTKALPETSELPLIIPTDTPRPRDEIAELAESIRGQWVAGMSKNRVAQLLGWKQYGGGIMQTVNAVIEHLTSSSTSTTQNMPHNGVFEAVEA